jgi:hypothetical protein
MPAGAAALRSLVGYVTQAPSVYLDLSVGENATSMRADDHLALRATGPRSPGGFE